MTRPRPLENPPNPWESQVVDYLGEPPQVGVRVYEDHSRTILAKNDSPDVGFTWSVNPYRGCQHACAYCLAGDTRVLMADGRARAIRDLRVGDELVGTERYRRFVKARVLAHWRTVKPAFRVRLDDGTQLVASGEHRFLGERGWKHVAPDERRPRLAPGVALQGLDWWAAAPPVDNADYRRGYLYGLIPGNGLLGSYVYDGRRRTKDFRLALVDLEALQRARVYLLGFDVETRECLFQEAVGDRRAMYAIRARAATRVERVETLLERPADPSIDWCKGFLAGAYDGDGSYSRGIVCLSNGDRSIVDTVAIALRRLGFDAVVEAHDVRIRGGVREHLRFFQTVDPAITRKRDLVAQGLKSRPCRRVVAVEPLGVELPMFDITTTTGDFIAEGVVSHNCYARPTHEYLGFGAGTDFDTRIVVKPRAAELLRAAFDARSWKGETIVFSGVTDCYQPYEASFRLTRACLEVCAEYRNPCAIITKAPLIERDLDVLERLRDEARVSVTVSVPFWDEEKARAIEPYVATPERRMKTIRRLAERGIPVGVNVAPIIPGLSDEDIPSILAAAREAGAEWAGIVLLRLPGSVKDVFERRVREAMPLRADKILHRIRETRGGLLYDPRWRKRQVGEGEYAELIQAFFTATKRKLGYPEDDEQSEEAQPTTFRRPAAPRRGQLPLFDG